MIGVVLLIGIPLLVLATCLIALPICTTAKQGDRADGERRAEALADRVACQQEWTL